MGVLYIYMMKIIIIIRYSYHLIDILLVPKLPKRKFSVLQVPGDKGILCCLLSFLRKSPHPIPITGR
jgi:hypothetical protein